MSTDSLTKIIDDANITSIRNQILLKKGYAPFFSTIDNAESVVTDFDHFPYTRFYRGVYHSSKPIVIEREAGWRPTQNQCYKGGGCNEKDPYPNHCFESGCSTTFPCHTKLTLGKKLDSKTDSCVIHYR